MASWQRRRLVASGLFAVGLAGLFLLAWFGSARPWLRDGLAIFAAWQGFWILVRIGLMVRIWRSEPALSPGLKLWVGVSVPLVVLFPIWWGRGRLSAWLERDAETSHEQP